MRQQRSFVWVVATVVVAVGLAMLGSAEGREARVRVTAFFSPDGGVTKAVSERIRAAKKSLDVAMYVFSASALATDVLAAHKRGVKVRVLIDGRMSRRWSKAKDLREHEVPLWRVYLRKGREDATEPQFHHKFAVIDGETVITGSFNWTVMAEESNHENLVVIRDAKLAEKYVEAFERALALAQAKSD